MAKTTIILVPPGTTARGGVANDGKLVKWFSQFWQWLSSEHKESCYFRDFYFSFIDLRCWNTNLNKCLTFWMALIYWDRVLNWILSLHSVQCPLGFVSLCWKAQHSIRVEFTSLHWCQEMLQLRSQLKHFMNGVTNTNTTYKNSWMVTFQTSVCFPCLLVWCGASTQPSTVQWLLCTPLRPPLVHSWSLRLVLRVFESRHWKLFMSPPFFSFEKHCLVNNSCSPCKGHCWQEGRMLSCFVCCLSMYGYILYVGPHLKQSLLVLKLIDACSAQCFGPLL